MSNIFSLHRLVWLALLTALIAAGAFIAIPLPISPVPVTLQDFFIILCGLILGPRYGLYTVLLYIAAGSFGLPIFSGGKGGVGVLLGPTGGYLLGFVVAVIIYAQARKAPFIWALFICFAGALIMLSLGAMRLAFVMEIPINQGFGIGLLPFLPGSLLKIICALVIYNFLKKHRLLPYD